MYDNPFGDRPVTTSYAMLELLSKPMHRELAKFVHGCSPDANTRTAAVTTLVVTLWQLAGRFMTHLSPSLVLMNSHGLQPDPLDALADRVVVSPPDSGPRVHSTGAFMDGTIENAPKMMERMVHESNLQGEVTSANMENQAKQAARFRAAQRTGFGHGPKRAYAEAWHETFGLLTDPNQHVILRLDGPEDRAALRRDVIAGSRKLLAPVGYGGIHKVKAESKYIAVAGAIPWGEWDEPFATGVTRLGLPMFFLPHPGRELETANLLPFLDILTLLLPQACIQAVEEPANLLPDEWFAHCGSQLRKRLRELPDTYEYSMQRMARQIFPVCRRLASQAARPLDAPVLEIEALCLDLTAHTLRGLVIGTAALAWNVLGFDPGCDRALALKTLGILRKKGPMSLSNMLKEARLTKTQRDTIVERFAAEDLLRIDGKQVAATTFEEFVAALYDRREIPAPVNCWELVAGKVAPAA